MIYTFYADIYLLQNMCMDYIALSGANFFFKRGKSLWRLFLIAMLSSVESLFLQLYISDVDMRNILLHFIVNSGMVLFAFGKSEWKTYLENWLTIYFAILFLGGVMEWETNMGISLHFFWGKALIAAILLTIANLLISKKSDFLKHLFVIEIEHRGRKWKLKGYWDSGNLLEDPYIGEPVNILQAQMAEEIFDLKNDLRRLVPYVSLGNINGLLTVCNAERMYIYRGKEQIKVEPAVLGIAENGLLEEKEYQVILQASILEKVKEK